MLLLSLKSKSEDLCHTAIQESVLIITAEATPKGERMC